MSKKSTEALTYDDVLLVPQYSNIESRSQIHLTTDMGNGLVLQLPVIASPMDTISGNGRCPWQWTKRAEWLSFIGTIPWKNRLKC